MDCSTLGFLVHHYKPLGVSSNSCPLSWWCHPTISSSVVPFSSCPQFFPASGSFPVSQLFASGGQSVGASASAPVFPMNSGLISFRTDWFDLLAVQGTLKSLLQYHSLKTSVLQCSAFLEYTEIHSDRTSLVVQWQGLCTPNAGGLGSISGQGTRSHMLQLKIPHIVAKDPTCHN